MGTKFLPTALPGNGNTSLSCIGSLLKCLVIHLGSQRVDILFPFTTPHLLEMPGFTEITIVSFPSLHSFWERNCSEDWKDHLIRNQDILTLTSILPVTSVWLWTTPTLKTIIFCFYFCFYFHLLDIMVRILHLLSYLSLISFKVSIYYYHFTD